MFRKQFLFVISFFFFPFMGCQLMEYESQDKLFPVVSKVYTDTQDSSSLYLQLDKKITNTAAVVEGNAFTVRSANEVHLVTNVVFMEGGTTLRLFLSNAITSHLQVTLSYESKKRILTSGGVFLPSFVAKPVENNLTGLLVWNKLDSSYDVNNSVVGDAVAEQGSPTFPVGKFGNSMLCDNTANYAAITLPNMMYRGTIAFWVAPQFDSDGNGISEAHPSFVEKTPWVDYPNDTGLGISYVNNPASGDYRSIVFQIRGPKGGVQEYATVVSGSLSFSSGQWMHIAAVWDINGVDGTTDTMRLYIDGVKVGSTNGAFPLFERKTFDFGRNSVGNRSAHSKLDNLQIYDYAKTDFNLVSESVLDSGLIVWNKLGSSSDLSNSVVGNNFVLIGAPAFPGGKFGNSMLCDNTANYTTVSGLPDVMNRGAISFWVAPQFDSDGNGVTEQLPTFVNSSGWADPPNLKTLYVSYHNNPAEANYGKIMFRIGGPVDGAQVYSDVFSGRLSFSAGQWMHIAAVWDINGIDGSSDRMRLYIDGVKVGSTNAAFPLFEKTAFDIGRNSFGNRSAHSKLDNLKIYNYAKTSFDLVNE